MIIMNNNNSSSLETQQYAGDSNNDNFDIQRKGRGSIYAMLQCILSEWGSKSQTNFYIPDDHYGGYSYLFEDNGGDGYDNRIATNAIHQNHHHHTPTIVAAVFIIIIMPAYKVYAKDPNNLHSHHYDVYMHGNLTQTTMHTTSPINVLLSHPTHQPNSNNVITTSTHSISSNNHLLLLPSSSSSTFSNYSSSHDDDDNTIPSSNLGNTSPTITITILLWCIMLELCNCGDVDIVYASEMVFLWRRRTTTTRVVVGSSREKKTVWRRRKMSIEDDIGFLCI